MPAVCSFTSGLHAHGPQLAPQQLPKLPVSHGAVLPWVQLLEPCPCVCPTGLLPGARLGEPCASALCPAHTFRGRFTCVSITCIALLNANFSENIS